MQARYNYIQSVLKSGEDLIHHGNLGAKNIKQRIDEMNTALKNLQELSNLRKKRLLEVVDYYQVHVN